MLGDGHLSPDALSRRSQTRRGSGELDGARCFRRAHDDQRATVEQPPLMALVQLITGSVSVTHRRNNARTADLEFDRRISVGLYPSLRVQRFHGDERQVLAVSANHIAIGG